MSPRVLAQRHRHDTGPSCTRQRKCRLGVYMRTRAVPEMSVGRHGQGGSRPGGTELTKPAPVHRTLFRARPRSRGGPAAKTPGSSSPATPRQTRQQPTALEGRTRNERGIARPGEGAAPEGPATTPLRPCTTHLFRARPRSRGRPAAKAQPTPGTSSPATPRQTRQQPTALEGRTRNERGITRTGEGAAPQGPARLPHTPCIHTLISSPLEP